MYLSGLTALDSCLWGRPGLPPGSVVEISGPPDGGKTALGLAYCRARQAQDPEATPGWVQAETNLNTRHLEWAGLDPARFLVGRQQAGLAGLELARQLVECGCEVIVIDSVAALLHPGAGEHLTGILGSGLPQLRAAAKEHGALVLLLNQQREEPGRRYTCGAGALLRRLLDARIHVEPGEGLYRAGIQQGMRVRFEVRKNGPGVTREVPRGEYNLRWAGHPLGLYDKRVRKNVGSSEEEEDE